MIKVKKIYKLSLKEQQEDFVASNKTLSKGELAKVRNDTTKLATFIELIEKGTPFILVDGRKVIIDNNENFMKNLRDLLETGKISDIPTINKIFSTKRGLIQVPIKTTEGTELVPLSSFRKIKELGGEPAASREEQQRIAMGELAKLIEQAKQDSNSDSITIQIYGYGSNQEPDTVYGVNGAIELKEKEDGVSPKNDFVLTTNDKNRQYYYISHKYGTNPRNCQQYSGVTDKSGSNISAHAEVIEFLESLLGRPDFYSDDGSFKKGITVSKKIQDPLLMRWAVFGPKFGGASGINNVDALMQGNFVLTRISNGVYRLFANHILLRKDYEKNTSNTDFGEGYEPTLMARHGDRNLIIRFENEKQVGRINKVRILIAPEKGRISSAFLKERRKK